MRRGRGFFFFAASTCALVGDLGRDGARGRPGRREALAAAVVCFNCVFQKKSSRVRRRGESEVGELSTRPSSPDLSPWLASGRATQRQQASSAAAPKKRNSQTHLLFAIGSHLHTRSRFFPSLWPSYTPLGIFFSPRPKKGKASPPHCTAGGV